jgi:hypothetical protein
LRDQLTVPALSAQKNSASMVSFNLIPDDFSQAETVDAAIRVENVPEDQLYAGLTASDKKSIMQGGSLLSADTDEIRPSHFEFKRSMTVAHNSVVIDRD